MKKMVLSGVALGMMAGPALAEQPVVLTAAELDQVAAGNSTVNVTAAVSVSSSNINLNTNTANANASVTVEAFDDDAILDALVEIQLSLDALLAVE